MKLRRRSIHKLMEAHSRVRTPQCTSIRTYTVVTIISQPWSSVSWLADSEQIFQKVKGILSTTIYSSHVKSWSSHLNCVFVNVVLWLLSLLWGGWFCVFSLFVARLNKGELKLQGPPQGLNILFLLAVNSSIPACQMYYHPVWIQFAVFLDNRLLS